MLGKISSNGFIPKQRVYASTRDTASSSTTAVPPENVLFKRKDAPVRYVENDIYFADQRQSIIGLPDSDLLKAIHSYTSDFYGRAVPDGRKNWKSLDETALLALGILMEEASRETLGSTGDLAITEGQEVKEKLENSRKSPVPDRQRSGSSTRRAKKRRIAG